MSQEVVLGVDIGTSSSKAVLARIADGYVLARAERPHNVSMPRPGWFEHNSEIDWWEGFLAIVAELLPSTGGNLSGICISGIGPCLLPVTESGQPLRPAILYGIDTRAQLEIDELDREIGAGNILARCGSPLTSQAVGPKLLWLRRHEPEVWAETHRFLMASSFIVHRLTGEYTLDHHSASQCVPMYDLGRGSWINDWVELIAPGIQLPRLAWPAEVVGRVSEEGARATGLPAGLPVAAGTIDAWSEALSVGVRDPGEVMLMYGTTMFMVRVVESVPPDPRLWLTAGIFPRTRTQAAGMATSGALTAWFKDLVGGLSYETLLDEAAAVPAGSGGILVLPYFAGERTPLFDPNARGVISGLTLSHGRSHVYRALLEATAMGVRHNLDVMTETGEPPDHLRAVGGGTRGSLWPQVVSDVLGLPQEVATQTVGASYGDALLAAIATQLVPVSTTWFQLNHVVEPRTSHKAIYDRLYEIYREMYPATAAHVHALGRLAEENPQA